MLIESKNRKYTCCFTGHRPKKLKQSEEEIKIGLEKYIRQAVADGFLIFVSGMCFGVDLWAAEVVIKLRDEDSAIKLVCASPYKGFERNWSEDWQNRYNAVLQAADEVYYVSAEHCKGCYQIRNRWLIDKSSRVIAAYNGQSGGTKNTINYAKSQQIEVCNVI